MGYWSKTMERFKISNRSTHPWAELLKRSIMQVSPEQIAELELSGDLDAFLSVKVDDCMKRIRSLQEGGSEYQEAKEIAFSEMLPQDDEDVADWEHEGAEQDAIDAFSDWIGKQDAGSSEDVAD